MKKRRDEQVKSVEARSLSGDKIKAIFKRCLTSNGSTPSLWQKAEPLTTVCHSSGKESATRVITQVEIEKICEAIDTSAT